MQGSNQIDHIILRSIQALMNRLPLLLPADKASFEQESLAEQNDVNLVQLLGELGQSLKDTREVGRKFAILEGGRQSRKHASGIGMTAAEGEHLGRGKGRQMFNGMDLSGYS